MLTSEVVIGPSTKQRPCFEDMVQRRKHSGHMRATFGEYASHYIFSRKAMFCSHGQRGMHIADIELGEIEQSRSAITSKMALSTIDNVDSTGTTFKRSNLVKSTYPMASGPFRGRCLSSARLMLTSRLQVQERYDTSLRLCLLISIDFWKNTF